MPDGTLAIGAPRLAGDGRRVRVLTVGPVSEGGGLARVARMTAEGFDPRRFDLTVCDTSRPNHARRSFAEKVAGHARRFTDLVRAIRTHRPHVVHLHTCSYGTFFRTMIDGLTCIAMRRRFVLHVHGGLFAEFLAGLHGPRRSAALWFLRRADAVVLLSESWRTNLTRVVGGLRIHVIPNAVETPVLHATDVKRGGGIVFLGDLGETKRPEDLLVAYSALPSALQQKFALTVIGDGEPHRRELVHLLAERLGIADRVHFAGAVPHAEAQRILARADLYTLTSRAEGMPIALLEAMAAGTPAIATRVGAVPDVAEDHREAVLVDPQDVTALAKAMKALLDAPDRRAALGRAAADRVRTEFSPERFRSKLAELWTALAPAERPRRTELPRLATSTYRSIL